MFDVIKTYSFLLILLSWGILCAQKKDFTVKPVDRTLTFHLLDADSGLSNNLINDIVQDTLGFIWIATNDGLVRYDGTTFRTFKKDEPEINSSISNNYIQQLKLTDNGRLLIATDGGLNVFDPKTEIFDHLNTQNGLLSNSVSAVDNGPDGSIIIGTYGAGIQFANKELLVDKALSEKISAALSSEQISDLATTGDGTLWVGTFDKGLNKVDCTTGTVHSIGFESSPSFKSGIINAVYPDKKGNIWVGSRNGIQVITVKGDTLSLNQAPTKNQGLSDDDVLSFQEDADGNMWIGTRNGGLNILDISSFTEKEKPLNIDWYLPDSMEYSVYNRTISTIIMDTEENIWLGTPTGLNFVDPSGEPVRLLKNNTSSKERLSHNRISALENSKNGNVWIGTDGGGLDYYFPKTGAIQHYSQKTDDNKGLSNNYIISLLEDSKNNLWVGTYRGGLNRIDLKTNRIKRYLEGSVDKGSDVRVIFEDINMQVWAGTNRGGLYKYQEDTDSFSYIDELGKIDVRDILEDQKGNLWLATYGNGLIKFNTENLTSTTYNTATLKGFPNNVAFCLSLLSDGDLLVGTRDGGLTRFSPSNNSLISFKTKDGLSNNTINSMTIDTRSQVWLGTFNGLNKYDPKDNTIINLNSLNNIQHGEFNIGAALTTKNGEIYFGGNKGLNILKPSKISQERHRYPIVIKDFKLLDAKTNASETTDLPITNESITYKDHIDLKHNQNSFSLEYSAIQYPSAANTNYAYRLRGDSDYWIESRGAGTVNITNLPPGEYALRLRARTGMGLESFKTLSITILHPFWKTWPAYFLYMLLLALITWLGFKYYSERIQLKNSLFFEKKQRQLEHNLNEERMRFFTAFSHELKTPLTLILAPLESLLNGIKSVKQRNNLLFVQRNADSLYRSIDKLLEFRKAEEGLSQLNIECYNLGDHLFNWVNNYQPLAKEKKITLALRLPEEPLITPIDLEKIQIIVNNLLSNAIKFCKEKGEAIVFLSHDSEAFKIEVHDSGTGIRDEDLSHIFKWYYHADSTIKKEGTGIGLALSKRFVELHNGSINVFSEIGKKTIFSVQIPKIKTTNGIKSACSDQSPSVPDLTKPIRNEGKKIKSSSKHILITSKEDKESLLLIDDNPEILLYLDSILRDDYDIIHAENGREGVKKATRYVPSLIISDIMMPEKNGIDLCHELKTNQSTSHIPIILLSAKSNAESVNLGFSEGADAYLFKPFSNKILKTRIRNLLDGRKKLSAYFRLQIEDTDSNVPIANSKTLLTEKNFLKKLDAIILGQINDEENGIDAIAQKVGMSRTSLYRKVKALTDCNINEYMRDIKIKKAAELIQKQNFTVSQASYEVGFKSTKYFRKIFKEKYGALPSDFK